MTATRPDDPSRRAVPQALTRLRCSILLPLSLAALSLGATAQAQTDEDARLIAAAAIVNAFSEDTEQGIPAELLQRAHGVVVIPGMIRGGFILGGRRGRGVLAVRGTDGRFSNPAFITLTSGSLGWQFGAQSSDVILVLANERSVQNIQSGRFTMGGDASVVAGPLGRNATVAATFGSEVYAYMRSRGLYAGAAFEGVRLDIDRDSGTRYYARAAGTRALGPQGTGTPDSARRFLATLELAAAPLAPPQQRNAEPEEAILFPLGGPD
jgi:lipid-binding SYLF domain-containing protein